MRILSWIAIGGMVLGTASFAGAQEQQTPGVQPQPAGAEQQDRPGAQQQDRPGAQQQDRPGAQPRRTTQRQEVREERRVERREARQVEPGDKLIATSLALANHKEIQLAELAQERAQSEEVKQFAREMAEDHREAQTKLKERTGIELNLEDGEVQRQAVGAQRRGQPGAQPAVPGAATADPQSPRDPQRDAEPGQQPRTQPAPRDRDNQPRTRPDQAVQVQPGQVQDRQVQPGQRDPAQRGVRRQGAIDPDQTQQVMKEIAQRNVQSAREMLEGKEGDKFDRAYLAMIVFSHMQLVDSLHVFEQHASPELQELIQQESQSAQKHLTMARQLMESLEGSAGQAAVRR